MLWGTFVLVLALAHIMLAGALVSGHRLIPTWLAPVQALLATILFGLGSISAANVETVTDSGSVVSTSEPAIGIYAIGMALIGFLLTIVVLIEWLPTQKLTGGKSSGF